MRGRPKKARTEAELHDFRLESSKMSHAKARREAWGEQHKSPSRTSSKQPPSLDELREAYRRRKESCEAKIRLGSMLEDIEAAHGVGYKFEKYDDSGTADSFFIDYDTPWQTGIRGFLKDAPDLLAAYKTLMRYKKLSTDFRKAIGLQDPQPASLMFDVEDDASLLPARKNAAALLGGCSRSFRALSARIAKFGQQSGLRPEPRFVTATEGARGRRPPVDVDRSHGA